MTLLRDKLTALCVALLFCMWAFCIITPCHATPQNFEPRKFSRQLHERINRFLADGRSIQLAELADFTRWGILDPHELPRSEGGAPRPFSRNELATIISEMARGLRIQNASIPELSGERAIILSRTRQEILNAHPNAQVIAAARDGLEYTILDQMSSPATDRSSHGAISFPYMGREHPSKKSPMYSAQESARIELIMNHARQILREVQQKAALGKGGAPQANTGASLAIHDMNGSSMRRDEVVPAFIKDFNQWCESPSHLGGPPPEAKSLLAKILDAQIRALKLDLHKPVILFNSHRGIKVLIIAARIQKVFPEAKLSLALPESAHHTINDHQEVASSHLSSGLLRDTRITWPFTLTALDRKTDLPVFRPTTPRSPQALLEWVTALLMMHNRATIGKDKELWNEWRASVEQGRDPLTDSSFLARYSFKDAP